MGVPWRHLFRSMVRMMTRSMLQTDPPLRHYDAALTAQVGGLATVVEIAADQTSRGSLVYHIPEASGSYAFVYSNPPIALTIPFTLHA